MTAKQLYEVFDARIPASLSEEWDNDGVMCLPDPQSEVRRVLLALDVTEDVVDYAVNGGFDVIISHHPLIFKPLFDMSEENPVARKLMKLIDAGVAVFSFHTRADRVEGGVNDCLAEELGLVDVRPLGEDGMGRIGELPEKTTLPRFAETVKQTLGCEFLLYNDALNPVRRVALMGGDGKEGVALAKASGADTYLSGRIGYNVMVEAPEGGVNLIEAGHYFTEAPVLAFFREIVQTACPEAVVETLKSNGITAV